MKEQFSDSIFIKDENGDKFWIHISPPPDMYERAITQEELESLNPEACYLDDVGSWSETALAQAKYMVTTESVRDTVSAEDIDLMSAALRNYGV